MAKKRRHDEKRHDEERSRRGHQEEPHADGRERPEGLGDVEVAVVGSANVDLVVPVEVLPRPGQTVLGGDHLRAPGGKGANQAVAAARLGRHAAMVARIGDDDFGAQLLRSLEHAGVETGAVTVTDDVPTGVAIITVDRSGENTIAVSPGANARLSPDDVAAAAQVVREARVLLVQLEVSIDTVAAAVQTAAGTVVLNPAPAASLPPEVLEQVDVLVPNRGELAVLTGRREPSTVEEAVKAARALPAGPAVVLTLGSDGAVVIDGEQVEHVPAISVAAVDATGAGDAFCGALADGLAQELDLVEATRWAVRAAGLATTRWGAQPSMPTRSQIEEYG
jgi:ribokinase